MGCGYSLGADVGVASAHSEGDGSTSACLVAEILLNMAPPASTPTVLSEGQVGQ